MALKKFFDSKAHANKERIKRDPDGVYGLHVWRMPKGSRKPGKFALCTELEFLNS